MENKYLYFRRILFVFSLLSVHICFVVYTYEIEKEFTNSSCYKSFSLPNEEFEIFHNNPLGPRFLLVEITKDFVSKSGRLFKVHKNYQLKRKDRQCKSSLVISIMRKNFSKLVISAHFLLYYDEPPFAIFIYSFSNDFKANALKFVDSKNNFCLSIEFSDSLNEENKEYDHNSYKVKSYLHSPLRNDLICLITEYNRQLVLLPKYIFDHPTGLITKVRVEFIKNKTVVYSDHHSAFECKKIPFNAMETVFLIYDGNQYDIKISIISWKINELIKTREINQISIINANWMNIDKMKYLPENPKVLFLIKSHQDYPIYSNQITTRFISDSGYIYLIKINKMVNVSYGIKRTKIFSRIQTNLKLDKS